MNNVDAANGVLKDGYGNLIDGTVKPVIKQCQAFEGCVGCPCYRKCLNGVTAPEVKRERSHHPAL